MLSIQKFLAAGLMIASSPGQAQTVKYNPGDYKVDPMHSKVGFEVAHLVISSVEGKFQKVDGQITLDKDFQKSKVTANAETDSIDTGVKDRDDHLRSPDFFDTKNNPRLTFNSLEINGKPESFKMTGNLTIKGVTKKVTFSGKYLGNATDAYGNDKAAFTAIAEINRKDFDLTWSKAAEIGPVVGDKIKIELKIQAARAQAAKTAKN